MTDCDHQLKALLRTAIKQFGPHDPTFTHCPVVVGDFPRAPEIDFFGDYSGKRLRVRLREEDAGNKWRRRYQLAHEAVHLLAPAQAKDTPLVEEGFATWFALNNVPADYGAVCRAELPDTYRRAFVMAERFLSLVPLRRVRLFRDEQPAFHAWTPETLRNELGVPPALAEEACVRIVMR